MTGWDKDHLSEMLGGSGSHFTAKLFRLIADASGRNRDLLREGFPAEVALVEDYLGPAKGKPLVEVFGVG